MDTLCSQFPIKPNKSFIFFQPTLYNHAPPWGKEGRDKLVDLSYLLSFISWLKRSHFSWYFVLSNFRWRMVTRTQPKHKELPQVNSRQYVNSFYILIALNSQTTRLRITSLKRKKLCKTLNVPQGSLFRLLFLLAYSHGDLVPNWALNSN